jgi:hypothetical protein
MKKTLTLTESELVEVINKIVESYNNDSYDDSDYVEVFLKFFRPWVKEKHGDEIGEYPLSYLVKKYISEFAQDLEIDPSDTIMAYRDNIRNASAVGKLLVQKGKTKLASLRSKEKFTEKYKKQLDFFINKLELPDFIKLDFIEEIPYNVIGRIRVDWEKLIKYPTDKSFRANDIYGELKNKIENFLGVEFGNPTYGQLSLTFDKDYVGVEDWVKKTLNKEIKKEIKSLPRSSILHAIRFETSYGDILGGELKLSFKSWTGRNDFKNQVKNLLEELGYNTKTLSVTT